MKVPVRLWVPIDSKALHSQGLKRAKEHKRKLGVMKRMVAAILCGILLAGGIVAQALEPRVANCSLTLTFDGTTAICEATCTGNSSTDQVKATIELYQGNTYLASWSNEGTYFVAVSGQRGVTRGKSYTLKLNYTINGVTQPEQSVTKRCR